MHTHNTQWATAVRAEGVTDSGVPGARGAGTRGAVRGSGQRVVVPLPEGRSTPLRVDAQRNLEHVLRAAREVFGELGYGAPMEDVARRARVGVGTVYRRFPSKDVLVRRIADEETARLTEQARAALGQEDDPWAALSRFLRTSVASGAGRLLPPQVLRVRPESERDAVRVPPQREPQSLTTASASGVEASGVTALLSVVGQLVERARAAGELREDVSVADVLLVIATGAPALPDAVQQAAAAARLLEILLEGLRPR